MEQQQDAELEAIQEEAELEAEVGWEWRSFARRSPRSRARAAAPQRRTGSTAGSGRG